MKENYTRFIMSTSKRRTKILECEEKLPSACWIPYHTIRNFVVQTTFLHISP